MRVEQCLRTAFVTGRALGIEVVGEQGEEQALGHPSDPEGVGLLVGERVDGDALHEASEQASDSFVRGQWPSQEAFQPVRPQCQCGPGDVETHERALVVSAVVAFFATEVHAEGA